MMRPVRERTRNMVRGCLVGAAIGDALGMPFETLDALEIAQQVPGGVVTGFIHDPTGCGDELKRRLNERRVGNISDDTQLTFAVAESLLQANGFELTSQVRSFLAAHEKNRDNVYGWGGTTIGAAQELQRWVESGGTEGRAPTDPSPPPSVSGKGCGNGVAMKIAPLAAYHALTFERTRGYFFPNIRDLGLMTHGDPRAWIAAACVSLVINTPLLEGRLSPIDVLDVSDEGGCGGCETLGAVGLERLAHCLICNCHGLEEMNAADIPDGKRLTDALQTALACTDSPTRLITRVGTSSFSLESVPFAIATFFRHPTDFRTAVLEAVNAGGDTDTTASMVGAMVGTNVGLDSIPQEWLNEIPATAIYAVELADKMMKAFYRK